MNDEEKLDILINGLENNPKLIEMRDKVKEIKQDKEDNEQEGEQRMNTDNLNKAIQLNEKDMEEVKEILLERMKI